MPVINRDAETFSTLDLKRVGAWRYAGDLMTNVWCMAYAIDDGPVQIWTTNQPIPPEFQIAATDPSWIVVAHNDAFESAIEERLLAPRYGWPLVPLERHCCTMAMALANALPGGLDKAAAALGLELRKDAEGRRLMQQMAKPRKPRPGEDPKGTYWHDDPEKFEQLKAYCARDVEVERALYRRLPALSGAEQALWALDAEINRRGFPVDVALAKAAHAIAGERRTAIDNEIAELTGGQITSANQVGKIEALLKKRGHDVESVGKRSVAAMLAHEPDADIAQLLRLRQEAAKASASKLTTLLDLANDDRLHDTLRFHGAATGRWSGSRFQPQNLSRATPADLDAAIAAVLSGELKRVTEIGPPLAVIGSLSRAMICAEPGNVLASADYSAIESRVLAWLAGETWKLTTYKTFDATGDPTLEPYCVTASRILGRTVTPADEDGRQVGKLTDLAFGYGGGAGAFNRIAPDAGFSAAEIEQFKRQWRAAHPHIVRYWGDLHRALLRAVRGRNRVTFKNLSAEMRNGNLYLKLPSGRELVYPEARIQPGQFDSDQIIFKDSALGKWRDARGWHGTFVENVVQAIARDLLATAMVRLEASGYSIVLHVHDEIVAEVPEDFGSTDEFARIMTELPAWAEDLPLVAKASRRRRYAKAGSGAADIMPSSRLDGADTEDEAQPVTQADIDEINIGLQRESIEPISTGAAPPRWSTPILIEVPPGSAEFEAILASLSEEDRAIVRPPDSNGHDFNSEPGADGLMQLVIPGCEHAAEPKTNDQNHAEDGRNRDGYPHSGHQDQHNGHQVAFFVYRHADGRPYLGVKKTSSKQFPQFHWNGSDWVKGPPKGPKIPYRLPELLKAPLDAWIPICAGEKDADTAAALGFAATTNPEGERKGAWALGLNAWFAGRQRVAIMEDNDATGQAHVVEVAEALRNIVPDIRIVTFRDLPEHGDLTDWKERGHGRDDLLTKIEATKPYRPQPQPSPIRRWDGEPVPELEYAVPDRYPLDNVGLFSGEGGQGKSSLVEQLCVAHVLEREWLGCTPRQGAAIYIECEDAERVLHWRLKAIAQHYGTTLTAIADAGFQMYSLDNEENAVLATAPDKTGIVRPTPLYDWLYELAGDIKPVMIGIASSANVFAGNENVRTEVQQFIRLLRRLASVAHGTVLLVTQPSLTGIENKSASHEGLAGTTQWHNAVRARAVMKAVKPEDGIDTGLRAITFHKNQYGPASATCFVRYTNGLFLPVEGMSIDAAERAAKADEVFIALLRKFTAQHQMVSPKPSAAYAPSRFAEHPEAGGITKKEFAKAMQRLIDAKVIEIRTWGRLSRQTYYLALVGS